MPISTLQRKSKGPKRLVHRIIIISLAIAIVIALVLAYTLFRDILNANVRTPGKDPVSLYIGKDATYEDVLAQLYSKGLIINRKSFEWVAERKNYPAMVRPGHYLVRNGMNNTDLVNMLRSGAQTPVKVIFNNIRTKEEMAGRIAQQIEADSTSLMRCWNNREFLKPLGTTPLLVTTQFIPNTYELWWTTDAEEFTRRMHAEHLAFWNDSRLLKAQSLKMSVSDIVILASIVEKETQKNDEKPTIAGVYLNRLRKGWPLQADPTVVFAVGNFELKRVLKEHTKIDSPYNTYLHKGLTPGPICLPSIASIDAVLDYKKHDYMYFCAKADLSGYHAFSRTLAEHNRNARAYQNAISRR